MGDMGDYFREWKEDKKLRKAERLETFEAEWHEIFRNHHVKKFTEWHYQFELLGKPLDYYPSTGKWRWKNRNYFGQPKNVIEFMKNRNQEAGHSYPPSTDNTL